MLSEDGPHCGCLTCTLEKERNEAVRAVETLKTECYALCSQFSKRAEAAEARNAALAKLLGEARRYVEAEATYGDTYTGSALLADIDAALDAKGVE